MSTQIAILLIVLVVIIAVCLVLRERRRQRRRRDSSDLWDLIEDFPGGRDRDGGFDFDD